MSTTHTSTQRGTLALTAMAPMAWGTTYLVTTELLPDGRPLLAGALRALPAGLILLALTRRLPRGSWWWRAAVLGVLNIGGFFALLFVAAERLHGGVAAALGAIQPLIAACLAALLLGERLRRQSVLAGVVGVAGVAMIVLQPGAHLDPLGVIAGLSGATSMAAGVTLTKRWRAASTQDGASVSNLAFTSWQLVVGGALLAVASVAVEGTPPALTGSNVAGFVWLATVGTAVAYALWFRGIARLPVANVALLGLLSPLVAVTAGYLVLDQQLGVLQLGGIAVVLSALWLGQHSPQPTTHAGPRAIVLARMPRVARRLSSDMIGKMFASRHC